MDRHRRRAGHGARRSEALASDPAADGLERLALEPVALAAVLPERERPFALDDGGEEPARADGGELVRVADENRLPLRPLDEGEDAGEDARLRHPRLVDDEYAVARESGGPLGLEQEAVEGRAAQPGLVAQLLRGRARGGGAEDGDASVRGDGGRADAATAPDERERRPLDGDELARRVEGGTPRLRRLPDPLDLGERKKPAVPRSATYSSTWPRRREKARSARSGTPAISAMPFTGASHSTPSERESSERRWAW